MYIKLEHTMIDFYRLNQKKIRCELYQAIYNRATVYIASADEDIIIDEIETFQEARWALAPASMWRLFEFEMNDIYLAVINLHLHLLNQQSVLLFPRKMKNSNKLEKHKRHLET